MVIIVTKEIIWEAIKEPLRLLVLAIIPLGLVYAQGLSYEWAVGLVFILRFIDKMLHLAGQELSTKKDESILLKGLTRF